MKKPAEIVSVKSAHSLWSIDLSAISLRELKKLHRAIGRYIKYWEQK